MVDKEIAGYGVINTLLETYTKAVNNSFNNHTHGTPSGPSSPPVAPYTSTNTAKSQNVKLS